MKRIKKFEIQNYIPEYRDGLKGIHFEDQKAIVTDGHYLIALQNLYPESMENITLNKNFTVWNSDYKFPNWKRVIPDISKGYHGYDIDVKDLSLCYKLKGNSILFKDSEKKLGYVSPYVLDVMIEFMNYFLCLLKHRKLIFSHWNYICVKSSDVSSLTYRITEEPYRNRCLKISHLYFTFYSWISK